MASSKKFKCSKKFICTIYEEDGEFVTLKTAPVDLCALLALADELSGDTLVVPAVYGTYQGGYVAACRDVAHRIREALGVTDG